MQENKTTYYYGLKDAGHAKEIAQQVCEVLGHGKNLCAQNLLLETACVETNLGTYKDPTPNDAGFGLTQGDAIGVKDVTRRTRQKHRISIFNTFGFDIRELEAKDLKNCPIRAFVFTRCFYLLISEEIPAFLAGRARYWKKYYNTKLGKGTKKKYIEKAKLYLYEADV
jgi:hypothetical protein